MKDLTQNQTLFLTTLHARILSQAEKNGFYSDEEIIKAQKVLGKPFIILKISTKEVENIVRSLLENFKTILEIKDYFNIVYTLFESSYYIEGAAGIIILNRQKKHFKDFELASETFNQIKSYFEIIDNWPYCDSLCLKVLFYILEKHDKLKLKVAKSWIKNPNMWIQRAALVCFTKLVRKQFQPEIMIPMIDFVLENDEKMIQKAIGWLLKEISKIDNSFVKNYILKNKQRMKKSTITIALEKMSQEEKKKFRSQLM